MVRLKVVSVAVPLLKTQFQFLVVRLKDLGAGIDDELSRISIPCGSIKSGYAVECPEKNMISIPCGSIKSAVGDGILSTTKKFQFLVVRLKVSFFQYL